MRGFAGAVDALKDDEGAAFYETHCAQGVSILGRAMYADGMQSKDEMSLEWALGSGQQEDQRERERREGERDLERE